MASAPLPIADGPLWILAQAPRFMVRNVITEPPFYLVRLVALGIGILLDLRGRDGFRGRYISGGFRTDLISAAVKLSDVAPLLVLVPLTAGIYTELKRDLGRLRLTGAYR